MLDLRRSLTITTHPYTHATCHKHNAPLLVYCETCNEVICCQCTINKDEHKTHNFALISECYHKHRQQIDDSLQQVKLKIANINTAITHLGTTERDVMAIAEQIQQQISKHAQHVIIHVQKSHELLSQQLNNIVKQKTQLLTTQKQQAQILNTQLKTCQEMVEHSLKEWSRQQILTEKHTMISQMNTAIDHVDPTVFQPIENANIQFTPSNIFEEEIGLIRYTTYGRATLNVLPCLAMLSSTATLTLQSQDGLPFSVPPSLLSCTLSSPRRDVRVQSVKCDITQTEQTGDYTISFTPCTREDELTVQVGGVEIPNSPFAITTPKTRNKPVNIITGLNAPWGIVVCDDASKDIIVAESGSHCITRLIKKGGKMKSFGKIGTKKGQFTGPCGVAVTRDGHVLVTDDHRLQKLTADGVCVKSVGNKTSGHGRIQFKLPIGIAVDRTTGQIFVVDCDDNHIQVFNSDMSFSHTFTPSNNKQFIHPTDVALDNDGHLYVAEYWNHCITKLTTAGQYVTRFGSKGSAPSQLSCPSSLTINNGLIYISEYGNSRVSIFDTNGIFVHCFGKKGSGEGELYRPRGITIDVLGNLFISDTGNNRIVVC